VSVNSGDLIAVVQQIHATAKSEAEWRCVCARAYYAVYQDALSFHDGLASPGSIASATSNGMHELFHARLKTPTIPKGPLYTRSMQIGHIVANLHAHRTLADYKRDQDVKKTHADTSAQLATDVLKQIAGGQPPAPPPPFVASQPIKVQGGTKQQPTGTMGQASKGKSPSLKVIK